MEPSTSRTEGGASSSSRGAPEDAALDVYSVLTSEEYARIKRQFDIRKEVFLDHTRPSRRPPDGLAAISEEIFKGGGRIPFHPFIRSVLDHFGIAPMQLTPNAYVIAVAMYIACCENGLGEPSAVELGVAYYLKKSRDKDSYYLSRRPNIAAGIHSYPSNAGAYETKFFFFVYNGHRHFQDPSRFSFAGFVICSHDR